MIPSVYLYYFFFLANPFIYTTVVDILPDYCDVSVTYHGGACNHKSHSPLQIYVPARRSTEDHANSVFMARRPYMDQDSEISVSLSLSAVP